MAGERIEGPTPNGGEFAVLYRRGGVVEIVEFAADGREIRRTYGVAP